MRQSFQALAIGLLALLVAACAAPGGGGGAGEMEIRTGRIEQITMTEMKSNHDAGLGAVLGGVAGAGLGSLIGAGTGKDVAIAAGAIIGAVGGNYAQKNYFDKPQPAQQIYVRLNERRAGRDHAAGEFQSLSGRQRLRRGNGPERARGAAVGS